MKDSEILREAEDVIRQIEPTISPQKKNELQR